ncbi:MAG: biopolymer transporter ExbD [Planctomycetia bacterium]|nr:biopolymer transporter ExbD [Planctomycetia bacterium]
MAVSVDSNEMEINLTPLLDLVLQLIMFFLACINFAAEQVSGNVQLPLSSSAQEIQPKTEQEYIMINIELVRKDRLSPAGTIVMTSEGKPVRDPIVPRTFRFRILGGEDITILDRPDQKALGLGRAMNRMKILAQDLRLRMAARDKIPVDSIKELRVPVIVRADVETEYKLIYDLIQQCRNAGFQRIELRAYTRNE